MKRDWWDKEFKIMFTIGDSITAGGWASSRERCWANLLTNMINEYQRVPVQLFNMGIGANLISPESAGYIHSGKPAAIERLDEHILSYKLNGRYFIPDLLIVSYGLNDARSGTPISLFCREMKSFVHYVRENIQPLIVLLGPYYINDFSLGKPVWSHGSINMLYEYNKAIERLAEELDCLFVNLLASYQMADWLVHRDGCHANDIGHRVVANAIFNVLASNCSGLSLETKILEEHIMPWRDESCLQ